MTKLLLLFCFVACLPVYGQDPKPKVRFTIEVDNVPLRKVIKLIERSGEYYFAYRTGFVKHTNSVSVHVINGTVEDVMTQALRGLGLEYVIVGNMITVRPDGTYRRDEKIEVLVVSGFVYNEAGEPLAGASIQRDGNKGTVTNNDGYFTLTVNPNTVITISSVGYDPAESVIKEDNTSFKIRLKPQVKDLDETIIMGYGKTSRRNNTGAIAKIDRKTIASQPVSDPIAAMQGRVPGLLITQSNGLPGTSYKIQLRGQSSIGIVPGNLPPNDPLFIIDGVPFAANNNPIQAITSVTALGEGGRSPLSFINIGDIDHIEVLKDADATAIYGSRGSNGVILISTRKGAIGAPIFTANVRTGFGQITRYPRMMNTEQYVYMRRSAFQNDGLAINEQTAPDLFMWDTTRYTDFRKMLIGGTAVTNNAQVSFSGGSKRLQYYTGASYYQETTVFPGNLKNERLSGHVNLHYQNKDSSLNITLSTIMNGDRNKSILNDLTRYISLAPHTPSLYDSLGRLVWKHGDLAFYNPWGLLHQTYESKADNLLANLDLNYRILKGLVFKTNLGYNRLHLDEISLIPISSQRPNPTGIQLGESYFGKTTYNSWIVEPQLEYSHYIAIGKISGLLGATMQVQTQAQNAMEATNYQNDSFLRDPQKAGNLVTKNFRTEYRYSGVFARLNSILANKILINLTGRIDGSSRFGPGKQVGVFWATGLGWIFSNESFVKDHVPFISFGKLRASYGITGNDQIGDYKYLDKWQEISGAYLGQAGITPVQLADSNYSWEVGRKLEVAIELGLFKDRFFISAAHYRNRTGNQLVSYVLPAITGFNSYAAKNSPALVQNTGWELMLQTKNRLNKDWQFNGNVILTIPRNKLVAFPNLANSSYWTKLVVGQPLSVQQGFVYSGISSTTGLFEFVDQDGDGEISYPKDYRILGHVDPIWYGSLQSTLQYKGWQLDVFWEFRKQRALSYLFSMYKNNVPGTILENQPAFILDSWQECNQEGEYQRFTTGTSPAAKQTIAHFTESNGYIKDASFGRLRNIELSFRLPVRWLKRVAMKNFRTYIQGQNLFTITRYKGVDPETRSLISLPPLRMLAAGIELSF